MDSNFCPCGVLGVDSIYGLGVLGLVPMCTLAKSIPFSYIEFVPTQNSKYNKTFNMCVLAARSHLVLVSTSGFSLRF